MFWAVDEQRPAVRVGSCYHVITFRPGRTTPYKFIWRHEFVSSPNQAQSVAAACFKRHFFSSIFSSRVPRGLIHLIPLNPIQLFVLILQYYNTVIRTDRHVAILSVQPVNTDRLLEPSLTVRKVFLVVVCGAWLLRVGAVGQSLCLTVLFDLVLS